MAPTPSEAFDSASHPDFLEQLERLIKSHPALSSSGNTPLLPLAEHGQAAGVVDFLDDAGQLLDSISQYYVEASTDASSVVATGEEETVEAQLATLATITREQIAETKSSLELGARNIRDIAGVIEAILHHVVGGLQVLETSMRESGNLPARAESSHRREQAQTVRGHYLELLRATGSGDPPGDEELFDRLSAAESRLEALGDVHVPEIVRLDQRLELRDLLRRLRNWLEGTQEPSKGQALWRELSAYVHLAHQINLNPELLESDCLTLKAAAQSLRSLGDQDPVPRRVLEQLLPLAGRDPQLSTILEQAQEVVGAGQLKGIVWRLQQQIETIQRSLADGVGSITAPSSNLVTGNARVSPLRKGKRKPGWPGVRDRLVDLPANKELSEVGQQEDRGARGTVVAQSSPRKMAGAAAASPVLSTQWKMALAGALAVVLAASLLYARSRGGLAEPPAFSGADGPPGQPTTQVESPLVVQASSEDGANGELGVAELGFREPQGSAQTLPVAPTSQDREAAEDSAGSARESTVQKVEEKGQSSDTAPSANPASGPELPAETDDGSKSTSEEEATASEAPLSSARKLDLPDLWIGDLVEEGPGVVPPALRSEPRGLNPDDSGEIEARVLVDHLGKVIEVEILEAGDVDAEDLSEALRNAEFEPATKDGVAVRMWVELQLSSD